MKRIAVCNSCGHKNSYSNKTFCVECGFDSLKEITMHTIAVYGSLKRGKYNHPILDGCNMVGTTQVKGTLYRVSSYPALTEEGDSLYDAEIYEVPDNIYNYINAMELGAGYKEVIVDGSLVTQDGSELDSSHIVYYADKGLTERCKERYEVITEY